MGGHGPVVGRLLSLAVLTSGILVVVSEDKTQPNGMSAEAFYGVPSILAVSCSGRVLPPDTKLMALVLFTARGPHKSFDDDNNNNNNNRHHLRPYDINNRYDNTGQAGDDHDDDEVNSIVASMDLIDGECYTSDSFSSCEIHHRDAKASRLRTLVMGQGHDHGPGQGHGRVRRYGCEVSSRKTGGRTKVYSWFLDVRLNSE